jgi:HEAT repeat protein
LRDARRWWNLAARLGDRDGALGAAAVRRLGELSDAESETLLLETLRDPRPEVRLIAVQALVWRNPDRPARPIVEALRGGPLGSKPYEPPDLREILRLGIYGLRELEPTRRCVEGLADNDPAVRAMSAYVLGALGDPEAVAPLLEALGDPVSAVREAAVKSLGRLGDPRALEPLTDLAKSEDGQLRRLVRKAIRECRR